MAGLGEIQGTTCRGKKTLAQFPCPPRLPNAYNIRDRSRRLVLGIGLGNLTGFTGVGVVASAMRVVVIYINKVLLIKQSIFI